MHNAFTINLNIIIEEKNTKLSVIHDYFGNNRMNQNEYVDHSYNQEHHPDGKKSIPIF